MTDTTTILETAIADVPMQLEITKVDCEGDSDFVKVTVSNIYEPVKDVDGNPIVASEVVQVDEQGEPVVVDGVTQTVVTYTYPKKIINVALINTAEARLKNATEIQDAAITAARTAFGKMALKGSLAGDFVTGTVIYEQPIE